MKGYGSPDNEGDTVHQGTKEDRRSEGGQKKRRRTEGTKEDGSNGGRQKKRRRTEVTEEEGDAGGVWELLHEIEGKY